MLSDAQPSINIDSSLPIPSAPDASTNMGPGYTYSNARDLFGTIRGEFDITDKVMAWAALGGRSSDESSFTTTPEVINQAGAMTMNGMTVARKGSIKSGKMSLRAQINNGH